LRATAFEIGFDVRLSFSGGSATVAQPMAAEPEPMFHLV